MFFKAGLFVVPLAVINPALADWSAFNALTSDAVLDSRVAAVSGAENRMEVWWINSDGAVKGAYWHEGDQWHEYTLAPAGSAAVRDGIAAVSHMGSRTHVWWIGDDGSVQGAYRYQDGGWGDLRLVPAGSASVTGGIASVSRVPQAVEVCWIGPDGSVQNAAWDEAGGWVAAGGPSPWRLPAAHP